MSASYRSKVWNFYSIDSSAESEHVAICIQCSMRVSRGGVNKRNYTTTNLITHLKRKHPQSYKEYEEDTARETATKKAKIEQERQKLKSPCPSFQQAQTQPAIELNKKWAKEGKETLKFNTLIAKMIATDGMPYSIVEKAGFKQFVAAALPRYEMPGSTFFAENELPRLSNEISRQVSQSISTLLESDGYISFTTNITSSKSGAGSSISFTAHHYQHGVNNSKPRVIHISELEASYTGGEISTKILEMLVNWNIPPERVHAVVINGGPNMKLENDLTRIPCITCTTRALQLMVTDGINAQADVLNAISRMRQVSAYFEHSDLAKARLEEMQDMFKCPRHQMIQDVPSRWDSTYSMLQRSLEQKRALIGYDSEYGLPEQISANEWSITSSLVKMLEPYLRATKELSKAGASISQVLPILEIINIEMDSHTDDSVIQKVKDEIKKQLIARLADTKTNHLYYIATMLDPRFKATLFDRGLVTKAKTTTLELTATVKEEKHDLEITVVEEKYKPQPPTTCAGSDGFNMWERLKAVIAERSGTSTKAAQSTQQQELEKYLAEAPVDTDDPIKWWEDRDSFPHLTPLATRFLSCPPSSVASESLYGMTEAITVNSRQHSPPNFEALAFIKANSDLI